MDVTSQRIAAASGTGFGEIVYDNFPFYYSYSKKYHIFIFEKLFWNNIPPNVKLYKSSY